MHDFRFPKKSVCSFEHGLIVPCEFSKRIVSINQLEHEWIANGSDIDFDFEEHGLMDMFSLFQDTGKVIQLDETKRKGSSLNVKQESTEQPLSKYIDSIIIKINI